MRSDETIFKICFLQSVADKVKIFKSILKICGETLAINLETKRAGQITVSDDRIKLRIRKNNQ